MLPGLTFIAMHNLPSRVLVAFHSLHHLTSLVNLFAQLGSIADRTILEADLDHDGTISFDEFVKVMEKVDVEQKMSIRFLN